MSSFFSSVRSFFQASRSQDDLTGVLTIRNLTSTQLTVNQTEALLSDFAFSSASVGSQHAQSSVIATTDQKRVLEPFSTNSTTTEAVRTPYITQVDLLDAQGNSTDVLFSKHGTSTVSASAVAVIYDATSRFLTLYETPDLSCWMKNFNDQTSIAALSIPGTHNSPTHHWALPSVRCQAVSPAEQLRNGVRFFDVRVQPAHVEDPTNDTLYLVHGAFPISLTGHKKLRDLVNVVEQFLAEHPSETLVMSLKREGISKASDQQLADILAKHYVHAERWYTEPTIPTLGQARGKIILMRRFGLPDGLRAEHDGRGWGLDAQSWADNTVSSVNGQVCVQDFYEVLNTSMIPKKIDVSCAQFERAASVTCPIPGLTSEVTQQPQQVYLNFLTASNFFNFRCWPENIAAKLNPAVLRFLCEKHDDGVDTGVADKPTSGGDGGLGIVVCDWVGKNSNWDLVKIIVGMNARRLMRERGRGWTGDVESPCTVSKPQQA